MMLAGCGAEVIRIESLRHLGFRGHIPGERGQGANQSVTGFDHHLQIDVKLLNNPNFSRYNFDKLSVALNLTKPEGKDIFNRLVKISDVIVDNLSFGVTKKLGIDYGSLRQTKEDIIFAALPSMGHGPHQDWTTWGMNLLSFTGFAYSWGHPETPVEERAASNTYGDYIAGMSTAASIVAALYHRATSGKGQYIEVSQTESTASLLGVSYLDLFVNNRISQPRGNRHPQFAPHNCYRCKGDDRWCVIAISSEDEWQRFRSAIGSPDWSKDARFEKMASRVENANALDAWIEQWTIQRTPHQVMRVLQSFGVAAGAVQNNEDLFHDLQLRTRGHMIDVDGGGGKNTTFDGPPVRLSAGQKTSTDRAPWFGEHNDYVYLELLGMEHEEIERLKASQVVF